MVRITAFIVSIILMCSLVQAAEIEFLQCQKPKTVIAKVESIEMGGGNEYLNMLGKKSGTRATLVRTYNPRIENTKAITDVDDRFYYYTYVECTFRFSGKSKISDGLFFVDKKDISDKRKNEEKSEVKVFIGVVDLPGNAGGSLSNNSGDLLLYEGSDISRRINEVCGIGKRCKVKCEVNKYGYIEKIIHIEKLK